MLFIKKRRKKEGKLVIQINKDKKLQTFNYWKGLQKIRNVFLDLAKKSGT